MSFELVHAWASRGLDGDGPGFVTVARTVGLPRSIERIAVAHSGHRVPEDRRSTLAMRRHDRPEGAWVVLTGTTPDNAAESGRIAHHLILDELDLERIDLARIVDVWRPTRSFDGPPESREAPPVLPSADSGVPTDATCWRRTLGDAGWAGEVLRRLRSLGDQTLVVLLPDGIDVAGLASDLLGLLPPAERSRLTFADRMRRTDEGMRLILLDETAAAIVEGPLPGGAALLDLRRAPAEDGAAGPTHGDAEASRRGSSFISLQREHRPVELGIAEPGTIEPPSEWHGPIEVRLEREDSSSGRWLLLAAAAAVVAVMAFVAFASDGLPGVGP